MTENYFYEKKITFIFLTSIWKRIYDTILSSLS